jgi:hypothetical protein
MPLDTSLKTKPDEAANSIESILEPLKRAVLNVYMPERDAHGNPSLSRFLLENGRLPFISDEIKPWKYRGWLVPYIQLAEVHPLVSPRYDYLLRTLDAGCLLDEPLPQIEFCGEFELAVQPGLKMLNKCLDEVEYKSGSWNGMREFCEWIAFAVGVAHEPSRLDENVQEFLYRNFNLEPLLLNPSDYLGQMLCETNYGKRSGFYPTPIHVVEMMCRMTMSDFSAGGEDLRDKTVMDPCVGTGRMLLIASNYSMRLFGQDIDYLCCLITKINLALYAPWSYIPDSFFEKESFKASDKPKSETKQLTEAKIEQCGTISAQSATDQQPIELSAYENLRIEKEKRKPRRKFSTKIDEQLPLFKI